MSTINDLSSAATFNADDQFAIWSTANSATRKVSGQVVADFMRQSGVWAIPEDYGAEAGGIDCADALQEALNSGKLVYIDPAKTYGIASQLTPPSSGGFVGRGTILMLTGAGQFDFSDYTGTTTGKAGIFIDGKTNVLVEVRVEMQSNAAIRTCNAITVNESTNVCLDVEITGFKECQFGLIEWNTNTGGSVKAYIHDIYTNSNTLPSLQITGLSVDNNRVGGVNSRGLFFDVNAKNIYQGAASLAAHGPQTDAVNLQGSNETGASNRGYGGHVGRVIAENVYEPLDVFSDANIVQVVARNCFFGVKIFHGASYNIITATVDRFQKAGVVIGGANGVQGTSHNRVFLTATGGGDIGTQNDVTAALIDGAGMGAHYNVIEVTAFSASGNLDYIAAIAGGDNNSITYEGAGWAQAADRIVNGVGNQMRRKRKAHVRANLASNTSFANDTTIVFGNETIDTYGEYNPATGVYTAKATTTVRVKVAFRATSIPAGAEYGSYIRKGGTTIARKTDKNVGASTQDLYHEHSATVNVVPGDTIFIRTDSSGNTFTYTGGEAATFLEIEEI